MADQSMAILVCIVGFTRFGELSAGTFGGPLFRSKKSWIRWLRSIARERAAAIIVCALRCDGLGALVGEGFF